MKAYIAFARSGFLSSLAYRNEVWANIFGKLVQVFARVAIWLAAYAGMTAVDGPPGITALSLRPFQTPPAMASKSSNGMPMRTS